MLASFPLSTNTFSDLFEDGFWYATIFLQQNNIILINLINNLLLYRWMGEKYDGVRACWHPGNMKFYTRVGNELSFPIAFYGVLPRSLFLDCEVWYDCIFIIIIIIVKKRKDMKKGKRKRTLCNKKD